MFNNHWKRMKWHAPVTETQRQIETAAAIAGALLVNKPSKAITSFTRELICFFCKHALSMEAASSQHPTWDSYCYIHKLTLWALQYNLVSLLKYLCTLRENPSQYFLIPFVTMFRFPNDKINDSLPFISNFPYTNLTCVKHLFLAWRPAKRQRFHAYFKIHLSSHSSIMAAELTSLKKVTSSIPSTAYESWQHHV